jgi:hypothetical protein
MRMRTETTGSNPQSLCALRIFVLVKKALDTGGELSDNMEVNLHLKGDENG